MDFKWSYDQQEPSCFVPHMYEPPNNSYLAVIHSTDIGAHTVGPTLDLSADYVRYYLGNEPNGEIDIGTITPPSQLDMETKSGVVPYQPILTDDLIRSEIKQVDEAILRMKEADTKPVPCQVESMDVDDLSAVQEPQDWHYVQFIDDFGSTQCFAVNSETQEQKQPVEQMNTQNQLLPQQPDCSSKLYRLLNNLPSESTLPKNIDPKELPVTDNFIIQVDPNSTKIDAQSNCRSGKVSISDGAIMKVAVEKMIEEICSIETVQEIKKDKEEFLNPSQSESMENAHPLPDQSESKLVPTRPSLIESIEDFSCDVVSLSPSNPESALQPVTSNVEIGPFCTAAGIFSNVFNMTDLPENRMKLSAEELKNGIIFEMHTRFLQIKETRKNFARVLSLLFDIQLDWKNPCVVSRLFKKAVIPVLAERADLVKCFSAPATRRAAQSRWKVKKENDPHQQISQFDAAVFIIPPDGFEEPKTLLQGIKTTSKAVNFNFGKNKSAAIRKRKPTQGEQLLELQTRFDAFRRSQRKHNAAFLRHIFLIQRELEEVKRNTSKRLLQGRRRSMPNPSV